jgi:hypothetical protein
VHSDTGSLFVAASDLGRELGREKEMSTVNATVPDTVGETSPKATGDLFGT